MGSVERVSASALILCGIFGTYLNLLQQPNLEVRQGEVSRRGRHLTEDGVRGRGETETDARTVESERPRSAEPL